MAKVKPNLYMDKYEVTNKDWKVFEKYMLGKGQSVAEYRINDVWGKTGAVFNKKYYSNDEYNKYPVAGVTYEGAQKYCTWKGTQSKNKGTFRLPTIAEVQYQITQGEKSRKWRRTEKWAAKKKVNMYNFSNAGQPAGVGCIAVSESYINNKFGIHNIKGNMAEMTNTKGKAAGGSYADKNDMNWATYIQTYDAPTNWLGFRCVCEL